MHLVGKARQHTEAGVIAGPLLKEAQHRLGRCYRTNSLQSAKKRGLPHSRERRSCAAATAPAMRLNTIGAVIELPPTLPTP